MPESGLSFNLNTQKHPCLQKSGSNSGYDGWKNSLKFKMSNYRSKMHQVGHCPDVTDVTVNSGKRGRYTENGDTSNKDIKKPRKGEIHFLSDYLEGVDKIQLEKSCQIQ